MAAFNHGISDFDIHEANPSTDLDQYFDLPETTFASTDDAILSLTADGPCVLHPGQSDCGCPPFDWSTLEQPAQEDAPPTPAVEEPDYTKFENWIPLHVRPEKPCDYCRSRRLNCYLQRGNSGCTPCLSLFRECSLTNSNTLEATNHSKHRLNGTVLDTLHSVDENAVQERGNLTGIKTLVSKGRQSGTTTPVFEDDAPGSSKRNGIRFPKHAVKALREWFQAHADYPYPNEKEKVELEKKTELKQIQITNWLANARRRRKDASSKSRPRAHESPSLGPTTPAIDIPKSASKEWDEMNPFERWKHSPPENEPASMRDIAYAVATADLPGDDVSISPSSSKNPKRSSRDSLSVLSHQQLAPSTTSLGTGTSKKSSSLSTQSARFSLGSSHSHGSFGSFSSGLGGKKDRKRRRRPVPLPKGKSADDKKRIFQCTFCTDTFKAKYDWTRHEKSLHLSLEKWICAPLGPVIVQPRVSGALPADPSKGPILDMASSKSGENQATVKICVYCGAEDPSEEHLETHNHKACEEKGLDARTFFRKDHLRQHLRLMHNCDMLPAMDAWKAVATEINSRCGFCAKRFTVWQERVDHLTAHFKAGARMSEWKGCRGLDPAVAAQVTNAMPPYLIGQESVSQIPFSASRRGRCDVEQHMAFSTDDFLEAPTGGDERATCWEILTVRLGRFASEQVKNGVVLTDEMLQAQGRRIIYESDDTWNQTAADNPEWLDLFKKAHGLQFIPDMVGGQGPKVPEDIEYYSDLGLRIPFAVQLGSYNKLLAQEGMEKCAVTPLAKIEASNVHANPVEKDYLPHHKWRLTPEEAAHFATMTPAWEDSGEMPPAVSTGAAEQTTSTGAMMEFLGNSVGHHLPFSADLATSRIPLPTSTSTPAVLPDVMDTSDEVFDWGAMDNNAVMQELDEMIAATTADQSKGVMAPTTSGGEDLDWLNAGTTAMDDVDFNEFTFGGGEGEDGVFDMQMDDLVL